MILLLYFSFGLLSFYTLLEIVCSCSRALLPQSFQSDIGLTFVRSMKRFVGSIPFSLFETHPHDEISAFWSECVEQGRSYAMRETLHHCNPLTGMLYMHGPVTRSRSALWASSSHLTIETKHVNILVPTHSCRLSLACDFPAKQRMKQKFFTSRDLHHADASWQPASCRTRNKSPLREASAFSNGRGIASIPRSSRSTGTIASCKHSLY